MQADRVDTASGAIRYWRGGKGAPLLLLHDGMGDAALHWSGMWNILAESHEVFAPDLPGFGRSDAPARATFPALTGWLDDFSGALDLDRPVIAGAGLGATLARVYSATHAHRCRGLVLIAGGALPSVLQRVGMRLSPLAPPAPKAATLFSRAQLAEMVVDPAVLTETFVAACQAGPPVTRLMRELARGPAPKRSPHAPALVLWGDRDRVTPPDIGRHVAADMPRAAFRTLARCGHLPQIEVPAAAAEALLAFLT
jgi:pimeloyl-ACP methyl ester carboxylesterase